MKIIVQLLLLAVVLFGITSYGVGPAPQFDEYHSGSQNYRSLVIPDTTPPICGTLGSITTDHQLMTAFASGSPVKGTLISEGDSMADSYRSIAFCLMDHLGSKYGVSGYALGNYRNNTLTYFQGGSFFANPDAPEWRKYWHTGFSVLVPGGQVAWEKQYTPWGIWSDTIGVFVAQYPGGGDFVFKVSTNGGPFGVVITTNGYNPSVDGEGVFIGVKLPHNYYRFLVEGTTGSNIIIGPYIDDSTAPGFLAAFSDRGGISLGNITNVSSSVRDPILSTLANLRNGSTNTLLIWHMKEPVDDTLYPRLTNYNDSVERDLPGALVVYLGTPFTYLDIGHQETNTITVIHNSIVRSFVGEYPERMYVDCMNPSVGYEWMLSQAFIMPVPGDGIHLTREGSTYLLPVLWDSLGLFSGVSNTITSLEHQLSGETTICYNASTNATYTVQSSADLVTWTTREGTVSSGIGGWKTNIFVSTDLVSFYRLRLSPP